MKRNILITDNMKSLEQYARFEVITKYAGWQNYMY